MIISAIVALAEKNVIGANNQLIWHLPSDLKRFKNLTTGHHIVMGRKTFDSIGKPLPNRMNIVITRDLTWKSEGIIAVQNFEEAVKIANTNNEQELFVIGGGQIYHQYFEKFNKLYVTKIHQTFEGDTFFPNIDIDKWEIKEITEGILDDKNLLKHTFINYSRK